MSLKIKWPEDKQTGKASTSGPSEARKSKFLFQADFLCCRIACFSVIAILRSAHTKSSLLVDNILKKDFAAESDRAIGCQAYVLINKSNTLKT